MAELREIHFLNITTPTPPKSQFYYSIYPGIYIRKIADRDLTIRTYFLNIVGYIFGSTFWYVSDCTAILATFNSNNEFYVRSSSSERTINIWSFKIIVWPIEKSYKLDLFHSELKIYKVVLEQAILQNLIEPRVYKSKVLKEDEMVSFIKNYWDWVKLELIDIIAEENGYKTAKHRFFDIYWKLKKTRIISPDEKSIILKTLQRGEDVDYERIKKFEILQNKLLFIELWESAPFYFEDEKYKQNFCFFESYFSNYIEGTILSIDDAEEIIHKGEEYTKPSIDSHNVLDLYKYLMFFYSTYQKQGFHTIDNYEDFKALVCSIHGTFGKRTIMEAGIFKTVNNELKSGYKFVDKTKLEGTLRQGFEMGKALDSNIKKWLFYHYVITECHPFNDGNGRLSRIVLNYYLLLDKQVPFIITEKMRTGYLRTLSDMSRTGNPQYYVRFFREVADRMNSVDFFVSWKTNELSKDVDDNSTEVQNIFEVMTNQE